MLVGGVNRRVDFAKLSPTLVIASSLVLASAPFAGVSEWDTFSEDHNVRATPWLINAALANRNRVELPSSQLYCPVRGGIQQRLGKSEVKGSGLGHF